MNILPQFSNIKNKLPHIKRIFSGIDLFSKKECAGDTRLMRKWHMTDEKRNIDRKDSLR